MKVNQKHLIKVHSLFSCNMVINVVFHKKKSKFEERSDDCQLNCVLYTKYYNLFKKCITI